MFLELGSAPVADKPTSSPETAKIIIVRSARGGTVELVASELTPVKPGDVIKVPQMTLRPSLGGETQTR